MAVRIQFGSASRVGGVIGGVVGALFCAVFLGAGLLFTWLAGREVLASVRTHQWTRTDCEVVASGVQSHDGDYVVEVEYRYSFQGRRYTSTRSALKEESFSDYGAAQRLANRYAAGTQTVCYVDPAHPDQAILKRGSLWSGLVVLFPLVFVAFGGGGVFFSLRSVVRSLRKTPASDATGPAGPLSEKASLGKGRAVGVLFGGIFLLAGLAAFYALTLRPLVAMARARQWQRTPCVVITSEVRSHSDSDGATYSVNILYAYEYGGREYKANRHHFMGGSSSGYEGKARIVRRYPPGTRTFCYVDPADPTQAVLDRGFTADMLFGLIPLVFVGFGAGALWLVLRHGQGQFLPGAKSAHSPARSGRQAGSPPEEEARLAPRVLKASAPPWLKLLGGILVAAFWNGIVSVFVAEAVQSWRRHHPEWFLTIFLIPFVVIGLGLIGFVLHSFLALFNPRPRLTLTPGAVPLGSSFEVKWEFAGRATAIERLHIHLEGREEAQYRRGTATSTDKSVFAKTEVTKTADRLAIRSGQARLTLPAGLMHSWKAENNKIVWSLHVHGDIAWWPDVKLEFPVTVLPQPTGQRAGVRENTAGGKREGGNV
jgi:hypothetical protein